MVTEWLPCHLISDMTQWGEGRGGKKGSKIWRFLRKLKMWLGHLKHIFKLSLILDSIVAQFVALLKQITFSNSQQCTQCHWWCHSWHICYLSPARLPPGNVGALHPAGFQGSESKVKCQHQGVIAGFAGWNTSHITHLLYLNRQNAKAKQRDKQQENYTDRKRQYSNMIKHTAVIKKQ